MKNCNALENQATRRFLLIACATGLAVALMGSIPQPARAAAVTPPPVPADIQVDRGPRRSLHFLNQHPSGVATSNRCLMGLKEDNR
jgi:hypothetical protein